MKKAFVSVAMLMGMTLLHAAAEQLAREGPVYASLAERLAGLLEQTGGQGYPPCAFTLARVADEPSEE